MMANETTRPETPFDAQIQAWHDFWEGKAPHPQNLAPERDLVSGREGWLIRDESAQEERVWMEKAYRALGHIRKQAEGVRSTDAISAPIYLWPPEMEALEAALAAAPEWLKEASDA